MQHQFTTIRIADILDYLCDAVDTARDSARSNPNADTRNRWLTAIDNGWDDLLSLDTIAYDIAQHTIQIESASEPGKFYVANGNCQCTSFANGNACRHRAAARLVRRALELRDLAEELLAEAAEAGETWYTPQIARTGARSRLVALTGYAADWDAMAEANRVAALGARLAAARAPYVVTIAA